MNKWKFLDLPRFSVLSLSQVWPWLFDRRGPEGMSGNRACAQSISVHCGSWHGHSPSLVTSAATFSGPSVSHYHFISLTTENQTISELYPVLGLEQRGLLCCQSKLMGIFLGIPVIPQSHLYVYLCFSGGRDCLLVQTFTSHSPWILTSLSHRVHLSFKSQISAGPMYIGIPEHKDMNVQFHLAFALVLRLYPVLFCSKCSAFL